MSPMHYVTQRMVAIHYRPFGTTCCRSYLTRSKKPKKKADNIQVRSKDSQVKTQLLLWIFILLKVTRWQHVSASITRPSSGHK